MLHVVNAQKLMVLLCLFFFWTSGPVNGFDEAFSEDDVFTEDIAAAIELAKREQKDLMVLFTGSDWCPPCKKLEAEVFSQPEFAEGAKRDFVLVKLDFPRLTAQSNELKATNGQWAERLGISGYPTIAVLDWKERPVGFLGYIEGGPEPFLQALVELKEKRVRRDLAFDKLPTTNEPEEIARLLDQGLSVLDEEVAQVYYADEIEMIGEIDEDNRLGLRVKYFAEADKEARQIVMTDILIVSRLEQPERAIEFIDEVLGVIEFPANERFDVLQVKLNLLQKAKRVDDAEKLLDEMIGMEGLAEETRERLMVKKWLQLVGSGQLDRAVADINRVLETPGEHLMVQLLQGQLKASQKDFSGAIELFTKGMAKSRHKPDILIEMVGALADVQYKAGSEEDALKTLDNFAEDTQMPVDLRCEALLQQAMIMREMGRTRPALLTENRAVELANSPQLKREIQNVVDQLRKKDE